MDRLNYFMLRLANALRAERGQTMAEYTLLIALVAVAAGAAFTLLEGGMAAKLTSVCSTLKGSAC